MSPLQRLLWLAALARLNLTVGAYRVAILCAELGRDGRVMHATGTIAGLLGVSFNTVSRAFDALTAAGYLAMVTPATQHTPAIYHLARVPTVGDPENQSRVPSGGESEGNPGSPNTTPRVPNHEIQGPHAWGPHGVKT